jgi:hypothetical protein
VPALAPLGQLVELDRPRRLLSLSEVGSVGFLYAKIGYQDALAFPDLLPGSIVRVSPDMPDQSSLLANGAPSHRIFLIEHDKGLFCCRLGAVGDSIVAPLSTQLSYAPVELHIPHEARLLGVVDAELRPLFSAQQPEVPENLAKQWRPRRLSGEEKVGPLLRRARTTMDLALREVSGASRTIAHLLGDPIYFISPSSLCDYELLNLPPRHIQKVISLCVLYGLRFETFLAAIGATREGAGTQPMADHFVDRVRYADSALSVEYKSGRRGFVEQLLERCEEVPFFLRESMEPLSGLKEASLDNCFWIGGKQDIPHPYLANGLLALVNRRRRRPFYFTSKACWQQPIYVLLKRDGTYFCACCGVENGTLVVHPYSQQFHRPEQFRYHHDIEVVGQIVLVARKLV